MKGDVEVLRSYMVLSSPPYMNPVLPELTGEALDAFLSPQHVQNYLV